MKYSGEIEGKYRQFKGPINTALRVASILLCIYSLLYASRLFALARINILSAIHNAIFLSFLLILVFLLVPARKGGPKNRVAWYDILLCAGSLVATVYFAVEWQTLQLGKPWVAPHEIVLGFILLVAVSEATRRTVGLGVVVVVWVFLLYWKFCYLIPGALGGPVFSLRRIMVYVYMSWQGLFGPTLVLSTTIIVVFVTFGVLLVRAGAGQFFLNLALSLVGHVTGGAAKVAVVGSALFGTLSGSAVSNVCVVGPITIPLMKSVGYKPHFASAVEAVASTGGILMPPMMGVVAFVLASMTAIPYGTVCVAAALPAILYYLSLFMQVHFEAVKSGLCGLPRQELPNRGKVLREGWYFLIPLALLIVLLMILDYEPILSAIYTIIVTIIVSAFRKETRMGLTALLDVLEGGIRAMIVIIPICSLIGVITSAMEVTGLGLTLGTTLTEVAGGSLAVLAILAAVIIYLMGMGVSAISSYILLAVSVAPAMTLLGAPLLGAHLFILYMTCSTLITPPYCLAAYVAATIGETSPMKTGFQAMRLGIVVYIVPFIIIFNPALLIVGGTLGGSVLAFITAIIGVVLLAAGVEGCLLTNTNWIQRILLIGAGLLMIVPGWMTDVAGIVLGALMFLWQWKTVRLVRSRRVP